jgi:tetratricopeptide (TPR) repeat protein
MTLDEILENAATLQQSGAMEAAERAYLLAISHFPDSAEARYRRGVLHLLRNRSATAAVLFRQALALAPAPRFYLSLGAALEQDGRAQAAAAAYRAAAAGDPDLVEAKFGLGRCQHLMGQIEAAIATYQAVLAARPQASPVWFNLGMALHALRRPADAATAFRAAITSAPDNAEAWVNLAFMLELADQPEAALRACEDARAAGIALPALLVNHASALRALGRFDEAITLCAEVLRQAPGEADAYATLTATLAEMGQYERAIATADLALEYHPRHARVASNKGIALLGLGRVEAAIAMLRQGVAATPDDPDIVVNLALALLTGGNHMREGFALFEHRRRQVTAANRGFSQPCWQGEDIAGRTILLHAEQGLGDTLQFVRYVTLVAARGARIILEVQPELVRLCAAMPEIASAGLTGGIQVVATGAALPAFDLHCPLLSLPHVFGTDLATIPAAIPYLAADPALVSHWASRLPAGPKLRAGLVWAGHAQSHRAYARRIDPRRSLALAALAPLGAVPGVASGGASGVAFVSLQKGPPAAELAAPPFAISDPMPTVTDFADTAALIAGLDLVITVDTAVAHLAGALGKPVWMLSRFDGCWRWLRGRSDSPWYPTLRLYRQTSPGDWAPAIAAIAADLARLASQGAEAARAA